MNIARKIATFLLLAAGAICQRLHQGAPHRQLNEDGSGQLIEDLVFGEKLVDASKRLKNVPTIEELTSDETIKNGLRTWARGLVRQQRSRKQADGSVRMIVCTRSRNQQSRVASFPYGAGWERPGFASR